MNQGQYVFSQLVSHLDRNHFTDLFDKAKFNDVKELDCPLFPGLFD